MDAQPSSGSRSAANKLSVGGALEGTRSSTTQRAEALDWTLRLEAMEKPKIVCLCGSSRFKEAFEEAAEKELPL
jgi:hypothetical protein